MDVAALVWNAYADTVGVEAETDGTASRLRLHEMGQRPVAQVVIIQQIKGIPMAITQNDTELRAKLAKRMGMPVIGAPDANGMSPILPGPPAPNMVGDWQMPDTSLTAKAGLSYTKPPAQTTPASTPGTGGLLSPTPLTDIQQNHAAIVAKMAGNAGGTGDPLSPIRPTSSDPAVQAKINENQMREQLRQAGIAKRSALSSPVAAPGSPEQAARLAAITGAQRQESTLQQAMSHPQATMTDDAATRAKLIGSHEDLGTQGQRVADQMLQAALAKSKAAAASGVPGAVQAAQKEIDDAVAAGAGMDQKFGPGTLTGDEAAKRIISANQFAEKQRIAKEAALANVNADWTTQAPIVAAGKEGNLLAAQLGPERLRTRIAQEKAGQTQYGVEGDPNIYKERVAGELASQKVKTAQDQRRLDLYSGGGGTSPEIRNEARGLAGMGTEQEQKAYYSAANALEGQIASRLGDDGSVSAHIFGPRIAQDTASLDSYGTLVVRKLEDLARLDPRGAAEEAAMRLQALPPPSGPNGTYTTAPWAILGEPQRIFAKKLTDVRNRLRKIAGT